MSLSLAPYLGAEEFGFCHCASRYSGLHHDARLPQEHLPCWHRDSERGPARQVQWRGGECRQLHELRRPEEIRELMALARASAPSIDEMVRAL